LRLRICFLVLLSVASAKSSLAEIRVPNALSEHAVLQRERPLHIWGWAAAGTRVTATLHGQSATAETDRLGHWSLYLRPEAAGGPYEMTLSGDGAPLVVRDLLIGDVWVASGQSNMEMPLKGFTAAAIKDSEKEIAAATNPQVRLLLVGKKSSELPLQDVSDGWTRCTPETAAKFSAIGYFFAREIAAREKVPIGVIDTSWGGTPIASWISMNSLGTDLALQPAFSYRASFSDQQETREALLATEAREKQQALQDGKPAPVVAWHPAEESWRPAGLYNGMIAPLRPLTVKGFLWYQGESDADMPRAATYGTFLRGLIRDWRTRFGQGDLPFLFVQISSYGSPQAFSTVRDHERRALDVAQTGMAVSLDVGLKGNIHPPDKQTVAARLALAARAVAYGEGVEHDGPLFRQATAEAQAVRVWFDHANGLTSKASSVSGFEIAGADHRFVPAEAKIDGSTVVVSAGSVEHPVYVRFGWASFVPETLYNKEGLPMSTFTSETD